MSKSQDKDPLENIRKIAERRKQAASIEIKNEANRLIENRELEVIDDAFDGFSSAFYDDALEGNDSEKSFTEHQCDCLFQLRQFLVQNNYLRFVEEDLNNLLPGASNRYMDAYIWLASLVVVEDGESKRSTIEGLIEDGLEAFDHLFFECMGDIRNLVKRKVVAERQDILENPDDDLMTIDQLLLIAKSAIGHKPPSKRTLQRILRAGAVSGGGRSQKSRWHYLDARDKIECKYPSAKLPTFAMAKAYLLDS